MAVTTSYKMQLKFGTMSGDKTWSFNYAKDSPDPENVKAAMETMIANGSIYKYPPLTIDSAKVIATSTTTLDVS